VLDVSGTVALSLPLPVVESFTFSGVPPGAYLFSVRAVNASGSSEGSNAVPLAFPTACVAAGTPINFTTTRSGNVISVSWNRAGGGPTPAGYVLTVTGSINTAIPLTGTSISGAVGPGSYAISVAATHPCGNSPPTLAQTVVVP
jgi:predicted phage tail protein